MLRREDVLSAHPEQRDDMAALITLKLEALLRDKDENEFEKFIKTPPQLITSYSIPLNTAFNFERFRFYLRKRIRTTKNLRGGSLPQTEQLLMRPIFFIDDLNFQ